MNNKNTEIPNRIYSIDGKRYIKVDFNSMPIPSDERGEINFELKKKLANFTLPMQKAAGYVLLEALNGRRKTSTVYRWLCELSHFSEKTFQEIGNQKISQITLKMFIDYCSMKSPSQQKLLRSVLLQWIAGDVPGVQRELSTFLQSTSPPKPKGMIEVQNASPRERPFSMNQTRALLTNIDDLYIQGDFDPQTNLVWRLLISEALRPSQLNLLRFGDVVVDRGSEGTMIGIRLMVPLVKQAGTSARDFMQEHRLSNTVAQAMLDHLRFAREVHGVDVPEDWPLFCISRTHPSWPNKVRKLSKKVLSVGSLIQSSRKRIAAPDSDFEGADLFSRRFKHTKLTHLAAAGAPLDVLAYAGYQTSAASLRRYVNLTEEAFAAYEVQMNETHAEIERAFRGALVERSHATHPDLEHEVLDLAMEEPVGSCSVNPCDVLACLGCYVCPRFEAFVDGPHKRVESFLVEERERQLRAGMPLTTIQLRDHILAAVRNIISRVEEQN